MRLVVLDVLEVLEFGGELLYAALGNDALATNGGDFVGRSRHRRGGGSSARTRHAGKVEFRTRCLDRGIERCGRVHRLARKFLLQAIEQIQFQPAIRSKNLVSGSGYIAVDMPRRNFRTEANYRCAGISRKQFDRKLVKAAFVLVQRFVRWRDEAIENRKFLPGIGLEILERVVDFLLWLAVTTGVGDRLREKY